MKSGFWTGSGGAILDGLSDWTGWKFRESADGNPSASISRFLLWQSQGRTALAKALFFKPPHAYTGQNARRAALGTRPSSFPILHGKRSTKRKSATVGQRVKS